jgi:isoaspartyl peptidase/L-asparaginase-like protein (Ntn-hydrolase superfamily)
MDAVVSALAAEILKYLHDHPMQADTDAHIARWWLLQSRVERALGQVNAALQYLEAAGKVERGPGGVYRLPGSGRVATHGGPR